MEKLTAENLDEFLNDLWKKPFKRPTGSIVIPDTVDGRKFIALMQRVNSLTQEKVNEQLFNGKLFEDLPCQD